jgi:hypothetical protein
MASRAETSGTPKTFQLGLIKDVLGIAVILGGFLSSVVAGAIWIDDLNDRLTIAEANIETNNAIVSSQGSVLQNNEKRFKWIGLFEQAVRSSRRVSGCLQ